MNRAQLIAAIAANADMSKKAAEDALNGFTKALTDTLVAGDAVDLAGLGKFSVKARPERQGRNPATGEALTISAANVASFKVGKVLKGAINA
jgi:DNA-binding protein HU-beta